MGELCYHKVPDSTHELQAFEWMFSFASPNYSLCPSPLCSMPITFIKGLPCPLAFLIEFSKWELIAGG